MSRPDFLFIPLLRLYLRFFFHAFSLVFLFFFPLCLPLQPGTYSSWLWDCMIPPYPPVPVSCLVPSQYISLGPDRPGLLALPGRLLIFFVSCFLLFFLCFCGAQKGQKMISMGWDCSIYDIMSLVTGRLCSFLRLCLLVDVYSWAYCFLIELSPTCSVNLNSIENVATDYSIS